MLGEGQSQGCHGDSTRDRSAKTLLVGHNLVVINRLIEMGSSKM